MTGARVLSLRTVAPPTVIDQSELFADYYSRLYRDIPDARKLFEASTVRTRHMAWDPRVVCADGLPSMTERMTAWEENVLAMGRESLTGVLDGVDTERIGSYVMASCTGYAGPTPEMLLAKEFGLRADLRRTFVGHMGCYAAFNALKVALDSVCTRPDELALLTSAEVCSVHQRSEVSKEQAVVHGLFADAGASMLLAADDGGPGPVFVRTHTETHYETSYAMTWRVLDDGFRMTLSPYVPLYLSEVIKPFVGRLLEPAGLDIADVRYWGVHPGGPKIIDFVGTQLGLDADQLAPSRQVLAEYGNCSSPTVLLILERILAEQRPAPGEYGVLMAFGPGLTTESALVRF